jgi:adenine-specific DNA-methyltransferase
MKSMAKKTTSKKSVVTLTHEADKRKNIPTAELQSVLKQEDLKPKPIRYQRNVDLDPQLVWRGKDEQDWSDLVVHAPPLYIQEKVHPKVLIDDLLNRSASDRLAREILERAEKGMLGPQIDLFGDFNGIPEGADKTDFYAHDQNWSNRMILGDASHVMASLLSVKDCAARSSASISTRPTG